MVFRPALNAGDQKDHAEGDDELRELLADPDSFAPGTKMTPEGLSEKDIAQAIAALKALR